jgi:nascent polypeptide-associated complex subunit alpha
MFPNINPKKMQAIMKQMGMAQEEIESSKVVIEKTDGSKIIIKEPNVVKIEMQGQTSFQITGEESEETGFNDEDIKTIMEKTGCTEKQAKKTLEKTGDLAEAILELSQ